MEKKKEELLEILMDYLKKMTTDELNLAKNGPSVAQIATVIKDIIL